MKSFNLRAHLCWTGVNQIELTQGKYMLLFYLPYNTILYKNIHIYYYFRLLFQKFENKEEGLAHGMNHFEPLAFVLSYFSGRMSVTVDIFARALSDNLQLTHQDQKYTEELFKMIAARNSNMKK